MVYDDLVQKQLILLHFCLHISLLQPKYFKELFTYVLNSKVRSVDIKVCFILITFNFPQKIEKLDARDSLGLKFGIDFKDLDIMLVTKYRNNTKILQGPNNLSLLILKILNNISRHNLTHLTAKKFLIIKINNLQKSR